jgi:hypothetical protein
MAKQAHTTGMLESLKLNELAPHIISNVNLQYKRSKEQKQSPTLWVSGPPGLGKSEFMVQLCERMGWGLSICYISQMTIDMMSGMPMIKISGDESDTEKFVPWSVPEIFNMDNMRVRPAPARKAKTVEEAKEIMVTSEEDISDEHQELLDSVLESVEQEGDLEVNLSKHKSDVPIILFMDDAHLPERSIQKYMFQLLGEKTIHKHTLPPNVAVILAGNRSEDKAGFQQILAPIANRIRWIDVRYDIDSWVNNYALPKGVRMDIVTFLQNYSDAFSSTPLESAAWPSPRSWTYAALELDEFEASNGHLEMEDVYHIVKGCVGKENATKFIEYRSLLMQWTADRILSGERKVVVRQQDAKSADDIVIGERQNEGLSRIECYCLMSATVGALVKSLRAVNFKPTARETKMIDIFKDDIIKQCTKKFREIVPLGLRSVLAQEKQLGGTAITRHLLTDNEVVCLISEIIK